MTTVAGRRRALSRPCSPVAFVTSVGSVLGLLRGASGNDEKRARDVSRIGKNSFKISTLKNLH